MEKAGRTSFSQAASTGSPIELGRHFGTTQMRQRDMDSDLQSDRGTPADTSMTPRNRGRRRFRESIVQESPRARVRRIIVLIGRFNAMAVPTTSPALMLEPLRRILTLAYEAFNSESGNRAGDRHALAVTLEQKECLQNLDMLSKGLPQAAPDAWRDLSHAMDTLLVQCVLLDSALADWRVASLDPFEPVAEGDSSVP